MKDSGEVSLFIPRLTIIGVGLIGGSLARALKERNLVGEVVGVNRTRDSLAKALELGVIDHWTTSAAQGVRDASLVLVATPVLTIPRIVEDFASALKPGCVVTDAGSVKGTVVGPCEALMPEGVHFVGGHPIAGTEHSGVEASFATLYEGSRTILTPTARTDPKALDLVRRVWEAAGSRVETMDVLTHDRVLGATSHLPHLIAYNVVNTLSDLEDDLRAEVFRYAAGGFRDFTRIASSDPAMWRDICLSNRESILDILVRFRDALDVLTQRVRDGDRDGLYGAFARSKRTRDGILLAHKKPE
ncbi:MAG: prephenate dehydrogenase/arogenate dehydrogenase family protein [Magnetococcales bacterium]|nr:prephenate dehydrogenase/arogenate dehydrogenase family protein [Magnetococcales bacterium]